MNPIIARTPAPPCGPADEALRRAQAADATIPAGRRTPRTVQEKRARLAARGGAV